ncbi:hypothetical protein BAL199_26911 [alpha proteobacterium BAL199]|nr:hypothetical protein BAL199_22352 [alpha proteobacterium BAL199]EDP63912.1 hypothetical protein BAL199_14792 [alpha proteobacterium BAL199]EDP64458.1 hypothetical protein BAL199_26911 [alpha proteobacterium BAL199]
MADPVGQRRAVEGDPLAGVDLRLAIERRVVGILRDQHMGDHGLGRQPAGDQPLRCGRLDHALGTAAAGIFRSAGDDHPELRRDDVEPLADVLADGLQRLAAAPTGPAIRLDHHLDPRQMPGQRPAVGAAPTRAFGLERRIAGVGLGTLLAELLLDVLQRQVQLLGVVLLRAPAEQRPLERRHDRGQPHHLRAQLCPQATLGDQQRLQRRRVVRQFASLQDCGGVGHGRH